MCPNTINHVSNNIRRALDQTTHCKSTSLIQCSKPARTSQTVYRVGACAAIEKTITGNEHERMDWQHIRKHAPDEIVDVSQVERLLAAAILVLRQDLARQTPLQLTYTAVIKQHSPPKTKCQQQRLEAPKVTAVQRKYTHRP